MEQKRALFRVRINKVGQISHGSDVASCEVTDLTEKGTGLKSELALATGDEVTLDFDLTPQCHIHCKLQIVKSSAPSAGGVFTTIAPEQHRAIMRFIEQQHADNVVAY